MGGRSELVHEGSGLLLLAGWTPDGSALLVAAPRSVSSRPLHLFDMETRRLERLLPEWGEDVVLSGMEFTSDGRYLHFTSDHQREFSQLWRYDMEERTAESARALALLGGRAVLNEERAAVQLRSCDGAVAGHFALPEGFFAHVESDRSWLRPITTAKVAPGSTSTP